MIHFYGMMFPNKMYSPQIVLLFHMQDITMSQEEGNKNRAGEAMARARH
jgi:hypothetical protein